MTLNASKIAKIDENEGYFRGEKQKIYNRLNSKLKVVS